MKKSPLLKTKLSYSKQEQRYSDPKFVELKVLISVQKIAQKIVPKIICKVHICAQTFLFL